MQSAKRIGFASAAILSCALPGLAPQGARAADDAELAKQLANPIASLISVPFQFNYDHGQGPDNGQKAFMNLQPVIPINLTDDLTLVTRTIVPFAWQNDIGANTGTQFGLGDTLQSFFLVPKVKDTALGELTYGAGPAVTWPTSTDPLLGAGSLGLGPTGVFLLQNKVTAGTVTVGALVNHQWKIAETRNNVPNLNNTFIQPFLSYSTDTAWTFSLNTEASYNWTSSEWSVPVNFFISKLVSVGKQNVQLQGGVGYWATSPDNGPEGLRARAALTFLFPK